MGMAYAIRDGFEDFDLTILFGSRTEDGIVYKKELDEVCAACDKVHVVHVLSDEEKPGYEHGFITAELIKKYGGEEYSCLLYTSFSALRQESITVSSSSEMPENSGAERITGKNSFIKIFFSLKFNRLVDLIIL